MRLPGYANVELLRNRFLLIFGERAKLEQIKLVIWDLDDTFWNGTISEGPIEYIKVNHDLVITLAQRGIISSICSKNDETVVLPFLEEQGISDYFVLPSIDWAPKGHRIKNLIENLNLRATNVLFLDDLDKNLEEARFLLPELNVGLPSMIESLIHLPALSGKPDPQLKRLKQYKVLEQKISEQSTFQGDANEFLRQSEIQVAVLPATAKDLPRLEDLINRSNQLNFTKLRVTEAEIGEYLESKEMESGAVWVSDKYGDYGLAGFYAMQNGALKQFTFSCRILGLGVENWLYQKLGRPILEINGEVSTPLDSSTKIDWIHQVAVHSKAAQTQEAAESLLIKGGCDLRQLKGYLKSNISIDEEMNYVSASGFPVHNEHTEILKRATAEYAAKYRDVIDQVAFLDMEAFQTDFLDADRKFKLYSVLMDYTQGIYRYQNTDFVVPYGQYNQDVTQSESLEERYGKTFADWFARNFIFEGGLTEQAFRANLEWLVQSLPSDGLLILLNGSEVNLNNLAEPNRYLHHQKYNAIVDEFVAMHSNVELVDVRTIVNSAEKVTNNIRHYTRDVYQELAKRVDEILSGKGVEIKVLKDQPKKKTSQKPKLFKRILRRLKKLIS